MSRILAVHHHVTLGFFLSKEPCSGSQQPQPQEQVSHTSYSLWLIPDIAMIKEAVEKKTVSDIRRVTGKDMIANCLTKAGASAEDLLHILHTGRYSLPSGVKE